MTLWWPLGTSGTRRDNGHALECYQNNIVRRATIRHLMPLPVTALPGDVIGMDTMTDLLLTRKKNTCICVRIDRASRFVWILAAPVKEAKHVCRLFRLVSFIMEPSLELLTDNGIEHENGMMDEEIKSMSTKHVFSTIYHPRTSGQRKQMYLSSRSWQRSLTRTRPIGMDIFHWPQHCIGCKYKRFRLTVSCSGWLLVL